LLTSEGQLTASTSRLPLLFIGHCLALKMLSSVWDTPAYHTLWGYVQCGQSTSSIIARLLQLQAPVV